MHSIRLAAVAILVSASASAFAADAPKSSTAPAATSAAAATPAAPKLNKAEQALEAADRDWSKNAANLDANVAYYSDDAQMFVPNAPIANGKDEIKKMWSGMLGMPGFAISWEPNRASVAKSGDFGYVTGTYSFTANGPSGTPNTDHGKYVEVWKKVGGKWKCVADIFNSDSPAK